MKDELIYPDNVVADISANSKAVEIRNLKKSFGQNEVLKDISLDLLKKENLVVLGKSGSGKSVLIKCLVGLLEPDSGSINVLGHDIASLNRQELSELRKKIGFLFQGGALYDSMTVRDNLEFPLRRIKKQLSETQIMDKVVEVLENVGLVDSINKMPSELSGGMRKRIALARTIILDPVIMLYDEPTTGLDPITANEISQLINEVQEKYNTSSLIITHDLACARTVADHAIIIKDGEIHIEGDLEMIEKIDDPWIKSFFK
jgi:phospholipid/cholesterol/gamma-HCH transport system ATP-binding protein